MTFDTVALGAITVIAVFGWMHYFEERNYSKRMLHESNFWRDLYKQETRGLSYQGIVKLRDEHERACAALRAATGAASTDEAFELVRRFEAERLKREPSVMTSEDDIDTCEIDVVRCETEEAGGKL